MANRNSPYRGLLVEGKDDLRVIPELIESNGIKWEVMQKVPIVDIGLLHSDKINAEVIKTKLKESDLIALGLILDADSDFNSRWDSIRNYCSKIIPDFPKEISEKGLVIKTSDGINFGVWIMPDNRSQGMLETFLQYLIPNQQDEIWEYAQQVANGAKSKGAPFIDTHYDKAYIHTWLAWQNPPGRQLHDGIKQKIFDPTHPRAGDFVNWFRSLYGL